MQPRRNREDGGRREAGGGEPVGHLNIRLWRPFPFDDFKKAGRA
jgi:pyruvate/2-oxoacid:ferredoxin oxidoreductase alpha subunit